MATCGNKPVSARHRHRRHGCRMSRAGSMRVSTEENWASGKKETLSCPLNTWYFRTGTTRAPPPGCQEVQRALFGVQLHIVLAPKHKPKCIICSGTSPWSWPSGKQFQYGARGQPALLGLSPAEGCTLPTLYARTDTAQHDTTDTNGRPLTCSEKMPSRVFTS